jgi:hypothetical protein
MAEILESWEELEAQADRPEIQEIIRQEIRRRTIRVAVNPGGGIRILPGENPRPLPARCLAELISASQEPRVLHLPTKGAHPLEPQSHPPAEGNLPERARVLEKTAQSMKLPG